MTYMLVQEACTGCATAAQCPCLCLAPWTPPSTSHIAPPPPSDRPNMAIWQLRAATEQAFPAVLARLWHIHHREAVLQWHIQHREAVLQLQARAAGHLTPSWRLRMCAIAARSARARRQPGRQAASLWEARVGLASADSALRLALPQPAALRTTPLTPTLWPWRPSSSMKTLAS